MALREKHASGIMSDSHAEKKMESTHVGHGKFLMGRGDGPARKSICGGSQNNVIDIQKKVNNI